MPGGEDKQKAKKSPSRKAKGHVGRNTRRSEFHSASDVELYLRGVHPMQRHLMVGKAERKPDGNRLSVKVLGEKDAKSMRLKGAMALRGRAARNPAVATSIEAGDYVLVDGGDVYAVFAPEEVADAKRMMRGASGSGSRSRSRSGSSSGSSMAGFRFNRGTRKNRHLLEAAEERAAEHKAARTKTRGAALREREVAGMNLFADVERKNAGAMRNLGRAAAGLPAEGVQAVRGERRSHGRRGPRFDPDAFVPGRA
jgi:hypothetical protein